MASSSNDENANAAPQEVWDEEYGCPKIDDVLFAKPLREYRPPTAAPPKEAGAAAERLELGGRRRRSLTASIILKKTMYSFQLFRCEEMNKNILAMTEVGMENKIFYVLTPSEKDGKRKMEAKETPLDQRVISPVLGEIHPEHVANRSNLSIQQRLDGRWIVELRGRVESMKIERFYIHERVDKTFRSMNDVATFIAYNAF